MVGGRSLLAEKMMGGIKKLLLDLFFPIECVICGKGEDFWCLDCQLKVQKIEDKICFLCNERPANKGVCKECKSDSAVDELVVATKYTETVVEKVIHELKFNFIEELASPLANLLCLKLDSLGYQSGLKNKIIIPVPLHKKRFLERGFNQSYLLSKLIAKRYDMRLEPGLLVRKKQTLQQARLDRQQRLKNIKQAFFCIKPEIIAGQEVYLLDDVLTSGATMNEVAGVLKQAGAKKVVGLVIAHGS